jgi:hypothetical protein
MKMIFTFLAILVLALRNGSHLLNICHRRLRQKKRSEINYDFYYAALYNASKGLFFKIAEIVAVSGDYQKLTKSSRKTFLCCSSSYFISWFNCVLNITSVKNEDDKTQIQNDMAK